MDLFVLERVMFEREDWMLFRSIDSLGQKAGVGRGRIAAVVVKELVDNALDAGAKATATCEELPGGAAVFTITDDGPGIDGDDAAIAHLFSFRRGLLSSKLLRLPMRGALGNGLRVVMGAVAVSGGGIEVSTRGRSLTLVSQPDGTTAIAGREPWEGTGTTIRLRLGPDLRPDKSDLVRANNAIALAGLEGATRYTKKSSPHWYSRDAFYELCQGWTGGLDSLVAQLRVKGVPKMTVATRTLSRNETTDVLMTLQAAAPKPRPSELGACGPNLTIDGVKTGYAKRTGEWPHTVAGAGASIPFVVEVWAAPQTGANAKDSVTWFANRTPTAATGRMGRGERGKAYITGCGINHYVVVGKKSVALFISVTSPWIPITTDGKEPNFEPIFDEIESAVKAACRKAKGSGEPESTKADLIWSAIDQGVDKASSGGQHRYSLRQLYYAVRGILNERGVEMPDYGYFSTVVTDVEARRGKDLPGIYRDARGVLYHPHTGEQIPLGTLGVEEYKRRRYAFHKVLYIEKGGFLPLLLDAKWPERHDCAILTSQGFASRAARDVIDLLGDGKEPIQFFCVHDADGPGTLIYEKLREATTARGARRVEIHNLGLDPWEGHRMGLEAETFERKRGKVPVARYVMSTGWAMDRTNREHPETGEWWSDWLQTHRYELNAMTSGQFLDWLDEKIAPFERTTGAKLVPPEIDLGAKYLGAVRAEVRRRLLEQLAQEHGLDGRVNEVLSYPLTLHPIDAPGRMDRMVREHLETHPDQSWEQAVATVAARFAQDVTSL